MARMPLRHALALGLLQGPTELLPVSSTAHTALVPQLLGWRAELDPGEAKTFAVALHAGAGLGLALALRRELARGLRHPLVLALSLAPPVLAGYILERPIEQRCSGPRAVAANLLLGGVAMAFADLRGERTRDVTQAGAGDGLALGVAQALALLPGVSRNGATLTAARARGFARVDAQALSWQVALAPILGASALKGRRLLAEGPAPDLRRALAVGAGGAFVSTLAAAPLLTHARRARALLPFSLYRASLAGAAIWAQRRRAERRPQASGGGGGAGAEG